MSAKLNTYTRVITIISFIISAGLVLFIALNANDHLVSMARNNSELYKAYRISELMKAFRGDLTEVDTKLEDYRLSGNLKFLEEIKMKEREIGLYLNEMEKYFSGRPEEKRFYNLKHLASRKLDEVHSTEGRWISGTADRDLEEKSNVMKEIADVSSVIEKSLSHTTQGLLDNSVEYVRVSRNWNLVDVLLGVIVLAVTLILLLRDIGIRNQLEAELRIAKKQADDNATMKEQFMANMSHEIRTPMNAILGFTDLMQKTGLDEKQMEYVSAIRTSGANLLNIINDILDFSKIEAGKLVIERISFSVPGLIDSLRIMFYEKSRQKSIRFEVVMDQAIPEMVFGDPTRLTQILVNLVNNAIKFTDNGLVRLSCELKSMRNDVAQIIFRVKDTGIGIPADKMDTIFERFNQANKETTRKYGGTGLGLSIVRDLIQLQNGEITVTSRQNAGSEFIVTMTYAISHETTTRTIENFKSGFRFESDRKFSVLMAEDNELNQKLAITYLKGFGLNVEVAENGQIAVDKLREKKFDLVLMDIQMPVLDGYHAAQKIRQELRSSVPIVAMTAHIMSGEKEKCISYGMNDYISKPFKEGELYDVLSLYLKNPRGSEYEEVNFQEESERSENVVDFKDIEEMARGNKAFIVEMIELFLEKNPLDISEIETAITANDLKTVRAISHRMKTSVGFMGLKQVGRVLGEIEEKAESGGEMKEIIALFDKVRSYCKSAIGEFENALKNTYA